MQADPRVPRVRDGSAPGGGLRPAGGEDAQGRGHLTNIVCQCKHINSQKSCLEIRDQTQIHQINRLGLKGQYQEIFTSFSVIFKFTEEFQFEASLLLIPQKQS